jgi:hypothetical protein
MLPLKKDVKTTMLTQRRRWSRSARLHISKPTKQALVVIVGMALLFALSFKSKAGRSSSRAFLINASDSHADEEAVHVDAAHAESAVTYVEGGRDSGLSRLGRPFVINMEHRADRIQAFSKGMADVGVTNITVVRGVPHECPKLGLTLSHVAALQLCWASHWVDSCLIMEDDLEVDLPLANVTALIDNFYRDVKLWDVLMLSCNLQAYMDHDARGHWCPPYAVRVVKGLSAAGYVVKREYTQSMTSTLLGAVKNLNDDCGTYHTNDVSRIKLQDKDLWYTFPDESFRRGVVARQFASFSDVQGKETSYGMR